jgi:peptide/nickel transport system substrate-binding protein
VFTNLRLTTNNENLATFQLSNFLTIFRGERRTNASKIDFRGRKQLLFKFPMEETMRKAITVLCLLGLLLMAAPTVTLAQGDVVCETDVVVQADDWLSKIADKFLGDVLAFTAIAEATNAKAQTDDSYATIEDVNVIEVGWKLCIPTAEQAQAAIASQQAASPLGKELPADAAEEQVLRIATGSTGAFSFTFTPMQGGGDQQNWQTLMWMPPLYFDADQELQPGVFASWEANADRSVWIFRIDPRAKWSDGSPITAADVKGTWELMTDPLTEHGRIVGYIGNIQGFDEVRNQATTDMTGLQALDERTLQVTLKKPDPIFHWRIATTHMNPVKIEQARANLEGWWRPENNPAVSGPYMLQTYDPDLGEATLVSNPNWWLDVGPFLSQINIQFANDPQTLATLAQNNQVDASLAPLPIAVAGALPDWFRTIKAVGFNSFWIAVTNEPTNDPKVREALIKAVNFEEVFKAAFPEGGAIPTNQIIDPNVSCYDTGQSWYEYDPEGAKAALAASSYGSAQNLPKLRVTPRASDPALNRAMEAVMEFWRQNLGIENVEFKTRPDEFGEEDALKINVSRDDVVIRFPDGATYAWTAMYSTGPIASGEMLRGYQNPEVDALLDQALAKDVEDPQRCELTQQAQVLFMNDYPGIFFGKPETTLNASARAKNYIKGPDVSLIEPWKIYITK